MRFRKLGNSELNVSEVGLGCNNFGRRIDINKSRLVIDKAIEEGINFFDTADVYGPSLSEQYLGECLGSRRKDILIATKFGHTMDDSGTKQGASAIYIEKAVEASLNRLKTDVIDLYQLHTPDPKTPLEETLSALDKLVKTGKVRYIGCSNLPAWEVVESRWISSVKSLPGFVSCQDEYSLLFREPEGSLLPMAEHFGIGLLPYFPLASGMLTGKYKKGEAAPEGTRFNSSPALNDRYMSERNWDLVENLTLFANKQGHSILDLAFAWLLSKQSVSSVIAGATKPEQIQANVSAGSWILSSDELSEIGKILDA